MSGTGCVTGHDSHVSSATICPNTNTSIAEYTSPYNVSAPTDRYPVLQDIENIQAVSEHIHCGNPIGAATLLRAEQVYNSLKLCQHIYMKVSLIVFSYSHL